MSATYSTGALDALTREIDEHAGRLAERLIALLAKLRPGTPDGR